MTGEQESPKQATLSKLDVAAIATAILLSLACFAKGAVFDSVIALLLLASMPILLLALLDVRTVHMPLLRVGAVLVAGMLVTLCLQYLFIGGSYDVSAWMQSIGRVLLFVVIFLIALCIGSSESSSRLFLNGTLMSSAVLVMSTFFAATDNGVPTTTYYSYTHGFVNPNNAAAYLGLMLLLALASTVRFFRVPAKTLRKMFLYVVDRMTIRAILMGGFLCFCILLALAGLFMTGSRGGILVSFLCCSIFSVIVASKMLLQSRLRQIVLWTMPFVMGAVLLWVFANFGHVAVDKFQHQGVNPNSRFEIFAAVLPMIADHPLLGTGLGSFPGAFQAYRPTAVSSDGIIDKAHNSYLEFAAEMGLPATLLLLAALGWMGYRLYHGVRTRKERYTVPALGLSVWLFAALYSLIDFPLQIPGLMSLFIALVSVCVSQADPRFSEPSIHSTSAPRQRIRTRKHRTPIKL